MTDEDSRAPGRATFDTETLPPMTTGQGLSLPELVPGLTILCHPDPARVGEQARLPALVRPARAGLSRVEPDFVAVGADEGEPLGDPYISRRSITLERRDDGALVIGGALGSTTVQIDGERALEPTTIPEAALERGVVLELARRVVLLLHRLGPPHDRLPSLGLIGESAAMRRVREDILRVARTDVPVLLLGESGSGKELVAAAIHEASGRGERPYFAINMAAIPSTTAASELFGHARGAFTGATTAAEGYFSRAHGGTLFLDEVGDTPPDLQVMLLRVLETGEIQPVGAKQLRRVDVRLVAATESDLDRAVDEGRLRLSFLQRLAGFQLEVPPLRARREDIGRLLVAFLREELETFDATDRLAAPVAREVRPWLAAGVVSRLALYDWPGNVRQLRNVARQLVITCHEEPTLRLDERVERILAQAERALEPDEAPQRREVRDVQRDSAAALATNRGDDGTVSLSEEALRAALEACGWKPTAAARRLGIGRTTMYKLLAQSSSIRVATDIPEEELRRRWEEHDGDVEAMSRALEVSARSLKIRLGKLGLLGASELPPRNGGPNAA